MMKTAHYKIYSLIIIATFFITSCVKEQVTPNVSDSNHKDYSEQPCNDACRTTTESLKCATGMSLSLPRFNPQANYDIVVEDQGFSELDCSLTLKLYFVHTIVTNGYIDSIPILIRSHTNYTEEKYSLDALGGKMIEPVVRRYEQYNFNPNNSKYIYTVTKEEAILTRAEVFCDETYGTFGCTFDYEFIQQ